MPLKKSPETDKNTRCHWCGTEPIYVTYHDTEWGVPVRDDKKMFEFLTLESAQAGLSWLTVLKKREGYRKAFSDFDPEKVARFSEAKMAKLLENPGIVRNKLKVAAAVNNAKLYLDVAEKHGSFCNYLWSFVDGKPIKNKLRKPEDYVATSRESDAISKELKRLGFKFVGSTIIYAHMQATGMVNDHLVTCFRYNEVDKPEVDKQS
jgi:DNA-3-methyladenine glycosylase I